MGFLQFWKGGKNEKIVKNRFMPKKSGLLPKNFEKNGHGNKKYVIMTKMAKKGKFGH